jgi:hypothetical protein
MLLAPFVSLLYCENLSALGVRGVPLDWLALALYGRTQCVKLRTLDGNFERDVFSADLNVVRGTPQAGIILFAFIGGINDMGYCGYCAFCVIYSI